MQASNVTSYTLHSYATRECPYSEGWLKTNYPPNSILLPTLSHSNNMFQIPYPPKSILLPSQSHSTLPIPVNIVPTPLFPDKESFAIAAMEAKTFQHFTDKSMRMGSFFSVNSPWPLNAPITPEEMVEAGLFYTGTKDKVRCAYCRGILYNWTRGDNAFTEHKRHFPKCAYVTMKMKEESSNTIQQSSQIPSLSDKDRFRILEIENLELRRTHFCRICNMKESNLMFLPCRHLVTCQKCGYKIKVCSICRVGIVGYLNIFVA